MRQCHDEIYFGKLAKETKSNTTGRSYLSNMIPRDPQIDLNSGKPLSKILLVMNNNYLSQKLDLKHY